MIRLFYLQNFKNVSYAKGIVASGGFKDKLEVWASHDDTDVSELSSTHKEPDTKNNPSYHKLQLQVYCSFI